MCEEEKLDHKAKATSLTQILQTPHLPVPRSSALFRMTLVLKEAEGEQYINIDIIGKDPYRILGAR